MTFSYQLVVKGWLTLVARCDVEPGVSESAIEHCGFDKNSGGFLVAAQNMHRLKGKPRVRFGEGHKPN